MEIFYPENINTEHISNYYGGRKSATIFLSVKWKRVKISDKLPRASRSCPKHRITLETVFEL